MQNSTIILQPSAKDILELLKLSSNDKSISVKLTLEVTPVSDEVDSKEAMKLIGCKKTSLQQIVDNNRLSYYMRGRKRVFSRREILQKIENHELNEFQ